ncbi:HAD domain-containing protein [Flavobacterium sp. RHBU_3]|uniref:HAD domain-containing protein n=1 Tax=Flavobacterium sp. RHBU_3 TaxID=3391184 RepID=UPI003984FE24
MKIFLDIDGVMVHANPALKVEADTDGFYKFSTPAIDALLLLLKKVSEPEIILTTSHRFRYNIDEWKEIFKTRGIIINNLSRIERETPFSESRKETLLTHFNNFNISAEDILIIDDDRSLNGLPITLKERLILTNTLTGLTMKDVIL